MCGVSTQQCPSTQITLLERTHQSAYLNAVATLVDKKQVDSCGLKYSFLEEDQQQKDLQKNPQMLFLTRCYCHISKISRLAPPKMKRHEVFEIALCAVFINLLLTEINQGQRF